MGLLTPMLARLRGQSSGHFPPAAPEPAPKPAKQPSHLAWQSWNTADPLGGVRGRQMLQAVRRKSPRSVTPEDLSDPSLLGAGEHGGAMVAEQHHAGQRPGAWPPALEKEARFPFRGKFRCS